MKDLRIVSLIASATEIVCALGLRDQLVGRSHECDYPLDVKSLPQCTEPKFLPDGTSYEIDQRVKAVLQESLSVYRVHADMLEELQPTHIITQSQCEVCAVSLKDVEAAACELISSQPKIISLEPNQLSDVYRDIETVANALGVPDKGATLVERMKSGLKAIASKGPSRRLSLGYVEWIEPLMAGGNWMPELIAYAGAVNLFGTTGTHSPPLAWHEFVKADPEVIVVAPCGFDIQRTLQDMYFLTQKPEWNQLSAVKNNRVYVADGNQYFNRPGPRLLDSAQVLAEICYPDVFAPEHATKGWVRFEPQSASSPAVP
jgi:iron complex transport system substrate-binding protein